MIIFLGALFVFSSENVQAMQGEVAYRMTSKDLQEKFYETEINNEISLDLQDASLEEAFRKIADKTGFKLTFRGDIIDKKSITLQEPAISVSDALETILNGTDLIYKISKDGYLLIDRKEEVILDNDFQITIEGRVTDADTGDPLPGVTIIVPGTNMGTNSGINGEYTLTVPEGTETLVFSFVGYLSQEVQINGRTEINTELQEEVIAMDEAVVTAFGLQREQRSLGTAVGRVSGEDLAEISDINVSKSLSGRVSGVQVSSSSSGPGGSSRVIIRGHSSLGGNNQPLYVVDGVPIDNTNRGSAGRWGGYDRGDGIQNFNPNDIADISVLKGPNASALYGQRGANGVILITTKSGENREGIGINYSTTVTTGEPWILPDFQNEYGLGSNGKHRFYNDGNGNIISRADWEAAGSPSGYIPQMTTINDGIESPTSWGPKMNGEEVYTWDGRLGTYSPQSNNVSDFFDTQTTIENSLGITGGNETTNFRLSMANVSNNGLLPNHNLNRTNISFKGAHQLHERLSAQVSANYVVQDVQQRPALSDQQRNVMYAFRYMPRNTSLSSLDDYELTQEDINNPNGFHGYSSGQLIEGYSRHWSNATFTEQPNWSVNNTNFEDSRERIMGHVSLQYELADWASLSTKASVDTYTDQNYNDTAIGTRVDVPGRMGETVGRFREINLEVIASAERDLTEDITAGANVGGNYLSNRFRLVGHNGRRFSVPDLFTISNTEDQRTNFNLSEFEIHSIFAFGQFSFRDYWYIDWTARNDWSSTLPADKASFFYPSISSNFIWSDAFELSNNVLSYGSLRASWAQAGSSGDPYQLSGTYSLSNQTQAGQPLSSFTNTIPLQDLENELTTSVEIGTDLRFFNGRLRTDLTYYDATTENQILSISVPSSSGFTNRTINAGEITNRGIELLISGTAIQTSSLQWDVTFNFGSNKNEVVELVEGVDRFLLGRDRNALIFADPGAPYGEMYTPSARWLRDENGNRMIDPSGLPIRESGQFRIGNSTPDWIGGITNRLNFKGFTFNSLIDISQGGVIFSQSNVVEAFHGTTKRTLEGRDGTFVAEGVSATSDGNGGWTSTGQPNNTQVDAQDYWGRVLPSNESVVSEEFIDDASYVALREITLGYSFPTLVNRLPLVRSLRFSIVGRNLFYFERHTDGYSPEAATFNANSSSLGLEALSFPMARTVGFNLNVGL
ncbi:SusC/RagA family TonB-linked outer membrane protein [Rhodohalobacter sp. 8-1]|uniref:SusC/RagA family TonB-linked outer membrane protein n=1 Tax=Rhodohalobacter sp. 8-1 TaxID=3131972 RepID=UPI0030EF404C